MKRFNQTKRFVCVNKSGRKLYDADHIEHIEFRLYENRCGLRDIYKRVDDGSYRHYRSNNK